MMQNSYMLNLAASDEAVARETREKHGRWFGTIETALDQVIQGLNGFSELKGQPKGELESARLFLATRTFRSLHISLRASECGYYQQAATLIRTAMEDMLVAEDAETYPKTLQTLLYGDTKDKIRVGRDDLSYGAMAGRMSPKAAQVWRETYEALSVYATHPRSVGLAILVTQDAENQAHLGLRSHYDKTQLAACIELTAKESMNLMLTVMQLLRDTGSNWGERSHSCFVALDSLVDETRAASAWQ